MNTIKGPTGRILAVIIAFAGLLGVSQLVSPADSEANEPITDTHDCPADRMCGWQHAHFAGDRQATEHFRENVGFANDEYSSLMNRKNESAWFSEHSHGGGNQTWVRARHQKSNLDNPWWWDQNDEISSVHRNQLFHAHGHG